MLLLSGVKLHGVPGTSYLIRVALAVGLFAIAATELRRLNGSVRRLART